MLCFVLINSIPLNLLCVKDALTVCSLVGTPHSLALTRQLGSYAFYLKNSLTMRHLSRLVFSWLWVLSGKGPGRLTVLQTNVKLTLGRSAESGLFSFTDWCWVDSQFYRLTLSRLSGSKCWAGWLTVLQTDVELTLRIEVLSGLTHCFTGWCWLSGSKCWVEKDQADSLFYRPMLNWPSGSKCWAGCLTVLQTDVELTLRIEVLSGLTHIFTDWCWVDPQDRSAERVDSLFYRLMLSWLSGSKCWVEEDHADWLLNVKLTLDWSAEQVYSQFYRRMLSWLSGSKCWAKEDSVLQIDDEADAGVPADAERRGAPRPEGAPQPSLQHTRSQRWEAFSVLCCCLHPPQVSVSCPFGIFSCVYLVCIVRMLVWVGAFVCVCVCVCA